MFIEISSGGARVINIVEIFLVDKSHLSFNDVIAIEYFYVNEVMYVLQKSTISSSPMIFEIFFWWLIIFLNSMR